MYNSKYNVPRTYLDFLIKWPTSLDFHVYFYVFYVNSRVYYLYKQCRYQTPPPPSFEVDQSLWPPLILVGFRSCWYLFPNSKFDLFAEIPCQNLFKNRGLAKVTKVNWQRKGSSEQIVYDRRTFEMKTAGNIVLGTLNSNYSRYNHCIHVWAGI